MIKPERLHRGDKVAVVSLSKGLLGEEMFLHKAQLAQKRMKEDYGLELVMMPNALRGIQWLDEHPEGRAEDLMQAFRDPSIRAVVNAIGGDDTIRLLPYIDFEVLRDNPKIFTGFSDTTTNHFMMYRAGLVSYYGLSLMNQLGEYVAINPYTRQAMEQMLLEPTPTAEIRPCGFCSYETDKIWWGETHMQEQTPRFPASGYQVLQGRGCVTGPLLGGCIDVFPELLGTPLWPSTEQWRGKLLLLETSESDMPEDLLTALLRNLQAQGIFDVIRGIVVGRPAYREKEAVYADVYRRVVGRETGHPELPILYDVNVGHAYPSGLLPLGLNYELDADRGTLRLMEPATM